MADGYKLWRVCPTCNGAGTYPQWSNDVGSGGSIELRNCGKCNGKKYIFSGWCSVDTFTLPADLPDAE